MSEQANHIPTVFDSEEQHVGQVYAKALLQAATGSNKVDVAVDQLESLVRDVMDKSKGFEAVLFSPKMSVEDKSEFLDRVFGAKMDPLLLSFLKVLNRRHRLPFVRAISQSANALRDEMAGRMQVQVSTSSPLDAASADALRKKLSASFGKDIRLVTKIDPSILGGLVVRIGDTVYDGSVDGQLKSLRRDAGARADASVRTLAGQLAS